jgi:hypothetical protein
MILGDICDVLDFLERLYLLSAILLLRSGLHFFHFTVTSHRQMPIQIPDPIRP